MKKKFCFKDYGVDKEKQKRDDARRESNFDNE